MSNNTGYFIVCNDDVTIFNHSKLHMEDSDANVFPTINGEDFERVHVFISSGEEDETFDENLEPTDASSQGECNASAIQVNDLLHGIEGFPDWVLLYVRVIEVFFIALGVFGIIGNICVLCGLRSDKKQNSMTFLLKTLAITDIFFLVTSAVFYLNDVIRVYDIGGKADSLYHRAINPYIDVIVYPLRRTAHALTVWVVCLVGIHRFIVICYPMRAKQWCRTKIFKGLVVFSSVLSTLFCIESWIDFKLVPMRHHSLPQQNKTFTLIRPRFENSVIIAWVFDGIIYQIAVFVLPFILLLFITIRLIVEMRKTKKRRACMTVSANKTQEKNITRAIVIVLIVLTLCQATLGVNTFLLVCRYYKEQCFNTHLKLIATDLLYPTQEMFLVLNSSVNFIIYVLVSKQYRKLMLGKFCKCFIPNEACL